MPSRTKTISVEVRYAETDQMGVVHHAVYAVWFEMARTALCVETGFHYAEIERLGYLLMVTGLEVRFVKPARYGETVDVTCRLERLASRALRFAYEVTRGGERLATGSTDHLWVARESGRPCRIPEVLRPGFEALSGSVPARSEDRSTGRRGE
jgi:acyl-CoA thioester hydrolase